MLHGILLNMYQMIVLGLGFLLLFGAGYLIKNTDNAQILTSAFKTSTNPSDLATSTLASALDGIYVCDIDTGCQNPSLLYVKGGGEVKMTTSYENGAEMLQETGTWRDERNGGITVMLTGTDAETYPAPHAFFVRYASSASLSGLTFGKKSFEGWTIPVFRKQERQQEE